MKNVLIILSLTIIWIFYLDYANAEYRYKIRGPPQQQRGPTPPPSHQIKKKWHMPHGQPPPPPPRMPVRKRPIPVHNNLNFKQNMKAPLPQKRPIIAPPVTPPVNIPLRNIWKNNNNNNFNVFKKQEKPFLSSPTVKTPEYEYHIQTNNIPTHSSPIKHNDYKGPIHTIPAPKLSPADKPKNIETVKPVERETTVVQIQKAHQYQVTESSDSVGVYSNKNANKQQYYLPEIETFNTQESGLQNQPDIFSKTIAPLSTQELFKLFNTYQHQPSMSESTYTLPLTQQPQLQTHILSQNTPVPYQTLIAQPGLFQPETSYSSQIPQTYTQNYKIPFQPEYQTFNYEEPTIGKQDDQSVASSSDYVEASGEPNRNSVEALAQSQYVQRFFDTRTDEVNNNVEPDARPPIQGFDSDSNNEEIISGAYYAILPNQKAAETLTSLQEAGKKNSKNNNNNNNGGTTQNQSIQVSPPIPMTIYVPDDYDDTEQGNQNNQEKRNSDAQRFGDKNINESKQYEDDDKQDEKIKTENARSKNRGSFGNRNKPKKN